MKINIWNISKPPRYPICATQNSFDESGMSWRCRICQHSIIRTKTSNQSQNNYDLKKVQGDGMKRSKRTKFFFLAGKNLLFFI